MQSCENTIDIFRQLGPCYPFSLYNVFFLQYILDIGPFPHSYSDFNSSLIVCLLGVHENFSSTLVIGQLGMFKK